MITNTITYTDIENLIDSHFENKRNFMFICNKTIADFVYYYINEVYGAEDVEEEEIPEKADEYYVSAYFCDDDIQLTYEKAKSNAGKYKLSDLYDGDYYIFTAMSVDDVAIYLYEGTWNWYQINEADEVDSDDLIEKYLDRLIYVAPCKVCMKKVLNDFYDEFCRIYDI